jgi:hypothetical protein
MKTGIALLAGLALMACSPTEPTTPAAPAEAPPAASTTPAEPAAPAAAPPADSATADTCNMAQYSALVGKPKTDPGVPAAGPQVRIIGPGDQVTMDFSATRLNIEVNSAGVITGIKCG